MKTGAAFIALLVSVVGSAHAANYVFPGTLPSGCSGTGPSYTCGALSLNWNDTITLNAPKPATLTFNGNLSTSNGQINASGAAADLTLIVNGTLATGNGTKIVGNITVNGPVTGNYGTNITGNLESRGTSGNISLNGGGSINGSVTASGTLSLISNTSRITGNAHASGATTLAYGARIDGTTTAASVSDSGGCLYGNTVTATTGAITLGNASSVTGNVITSGSAGNISLGGTVNGAVTASGTLSLTSNIAKITGNANATGAASLAYGGRVDGTLTAASVSDSGGCLYGNTVTATTGAITLGYGSKVTGNVIAQSSGSGVVTVGGLNTRPQVSGCVMTNRTGSGSIRMSNWGSSAGGVCCNSGSACLPTSNACYSNSSQYTLSTAACSGLTTPNQVKVGSCTVSGVSSSYSTIQAAVNAVANNGTVWICPGTYAENVSISGKVLTLQSSTGNTADVTLRPTATAGISSNSALTVNNLTISSSAYQVNGINACPSTAPGTLTLSGLALNISGGASTAIYQGNTCQGLTLNASNVSTSSSTLSGIRIGNGTGNHVVNQASLYGQNGQGWPLSITGGGNITLTDVDAYQLGTSPSYYPAISLNGFTGNVTIGIATKTGNRCTDINGNANAYPGACISNRDTATGTAQTNRNALGLSLCNAVGATSQVNLANIYASGSMSGIGLSGGGSCGRYTAHFQNVVAEVNSSYFNLSGSTTDLSSNHGWAYPIAINNGTGTHTLTNVTANGTYAYNGLAISGGSATLTDVYATGLSTAISLAPSGNVTISNPIWAAANPYPATTPATFPIRGVSWNSIKGTGLYDCPSSNMMLTLQDTAVSGASSGILAAPNYCYGGSVGLTFSNVTVNAAGGTAVYNTNGGTQAHSLTNVTASGTGNAIQIYKGTNPTYTHLNLTCGSDGVTAGKGLVLDGQSNATVEGTNTVTCKSPNSWGISVGGDNGGCPNCTVKGTTIDMQSQSGSEGMHVYDGSGSSTLTDNQVKNAPKYGLYVYAYPVTVTNNIVENAGGSNHGIAMERGAGIAYNNCVYSPANHVIRSETSLCAGASPCNASYPLIDPKPGVSTTKQGNFWGSWPKGSGFSDACADANGDGLCDTITGGDRAPLKQCRLTSSNTGCDAPVYAGSGLTVGQESEINNHTITGSGNTINASTGVRSTTTQTLGSHIPASFPTYSGGSDYSGSASGLVPGTTYNSVTLTGGTAPSGTYYINTLAVNGDVNFSGGTFHVKTMTVDEEQELTFTAATQFRIGTGFSAGKEVRMRSGSGDNYTHSSWAQFYLYDGADWSADKELRFDGIVVANGAGSNITVDKELTMTGAFITGGTVSIGKEADITVNASVTSALSGSGICGGSTPTPEPTPPAGFNCVEVGGNASSGHLYTKVSGAAFNFDIVALKADGSVETSYASDADKPVTVALVDGSGSTACASRTVLATWPNQTFTAAAAGRITSGAASVSHAYANLRIRVSDGSVTGCSADAFSVRPAAFTLTSSANANDAGTSATATPVVKTGTGFTLTATATAGYNGTPALDTSKVQAHAGAVQSGALAGSFSAAHSGTGIASGTGFTYSEVGYFRLAANGVTDTTFTSVDSANGDCSSDYANSQVSGKFGCWFGNSSATNYFGRFIPDHFAVAQGTLAHGNGSFTYYGQDFSTPFTLYAQNSANTTTQNYTGPFARLALNNWSAFGFSAVDASNAAVAIQTGASTPTGSWNHGAASVVATHKSARATSGTPNSEANLTIKTLPSDSDGVTSSGAPAVHSGTALHRFGRLHLANAYGSELKPLPMNLTAQYWNGSGFVTHTLDSATSLANPTLTYYTQTSANQLASGETSSSFSSPLASGNANLQLTAPGEGHYGYVDVAFTAPAWLQYNWDGIDQGADSNSFDDNPHARAAFGKRNNASKVIIRREIY